MLILSRERPEKDVANICNRRIRHFAKIGSRRRCLRVLPLRTICSWSIVSLTHILTISHGGEFISSVCYLCRKTSAKKENFPFPFLKVLEVTTAQKILISLTFDTLRGFLVFFLYKHTATSESFCGFCKTLVGVDDLIQQGAALTRCLGCCSRFPSWGSRALGSGGDPV